MGAVGQQVLNNYGSMNSSKISNQTSFVGIANDLEDEIMEVRKELSFLKKEIHILNTEKDTVAEMAATKCEDIDRYLNKEIHYLEELIHKG